MFCTQYNGAIVGLDRVLTLVAKPPLSSLMPAPFNPQLTKPSHFFSPSHIAHALSLTSHKSNSHGVDS